MTPQTVMTVRFTEIQALEIVCKNCDSRISIPITGSHQPNLPHPLECVACNKTLFESDQSTDFLRALGLLRSLNRLHEPDAQKAFELEFSIRQ